MGQSSSAPRLSLDSATRSIPAKLASQSVQTEPSNAAKGAATDTSCFETSNVRTMQFCLYLGLTKPLFQGLMYHAVKWRKCLHVPA